jgi:CBS domain containing-hemolysin-like protein
MIFDTIAELKELFIETGYSKVVVYEPLDDIVVTHV